MGRVGELRGKGWRALGYLIWMLGAGVVLDGDAARLGAPLLAVGAVLFGLGAGQSFGNRRGATE